MKNLYILMVAMMVVFFGCNRSQYATTTRHVKKGKVTYVNNYPRERKKSAKAIIRRHHLPETDIQNKALTLYSKEAQNFPEPEITEIIPDPTSGNENLVASTSIEPTITAVKVNRVLLKVKAGDDFHRDTLKPGKTSTGAITDKKAKQVIEFSDGRNDTVRIIAVSNDTLYYKLISHPKITFNVTTDKIDTVYVLKIVEPYGVASTVLPVFGMFPIFGLPFAVLGLIFGIVSLNKINRNPNRYKRKGVAINGIVWGTLGTIASLVFLIMALIMSAQ